LPATPIRIAFCVTDLDPGGAERCLVQLATGLDRGEWEPRVYCLGVPGELVETLERANVRVECLGARSIRNVGVAPRLARRLQSFRPALLQTFLFHANLAGRIAGRWAGLPVIVSGVRVAEHEHRWHLWCDRLTQRLVTRNVCVSQSVANFSTAHGGIHPEKITVIPNGVDIDCYADARPADLEPLGIPPGSRTILCVGRLHPQKGQRLLLEAAAPLFTADPELHILLVGNGPLHAELDALIDDRQWRRHVHLAGRRRDVPELMRAATLLVLPSLWEGMPNVVLEAMAAGLPVIASDVEGVRELLGNDMRGIVFSAGSVDDLRAGLVGMLRDPGLRNRVAIESQEFVRSYFTSEAMLSKYVRLYRQLLGTGQSLNT
jgi:glycosyltransferase involved in cell wall biosynthesis